MAAKPPLGSAATTPLLSAAPLGQAVAVTRTSAPTRSTGAVVVVVDVVTVVGSEGGAADAPAPPPAPPPPAAGACFNLPAAAAARLSAFAFSIAACLASSRCRFSFWARLLAAFSDTGARLPSPSLPPLLVRLLLRLRRRGMVCSKVWSVLCDPVVTAESYPSKFK